jgi:tripartite-type tricarboxylate transporter receptor subunit TctC
MSHRYGLGFLLAWSTVLCGAVHAQAYPDRPLRMVAPWPPGSTTDGSARIVRAKGIENED